MEHLALSPDGTLAIGAGIRPDPEITKVKEDTRSHLRSTLEFLGIVGSGVAGTAAFIGAEAALGTIGAGAVAAATGWVTDKLAGKAIDKVAGPDPSLAA